MTEERETMDVDVLFVGAGPATLAGAYHLQSLINKHNEQVTSTGEGTSLEPMIAIIEKGKEIGAHSFSGAVLDPIALKELVPDFKEKGFPFENTIEREDVLYLTPKSSFRFPITPPQLRNHGFFTLSLSKFTRWLGGLVEELGVRHRQERRAEEQLRARNRSQSQGDRIRRRGPGLPVQAAG
jgi:electron-transferring-flavoprotein dehydrogenase